MTKKTKQIENIVEVVKELTAYIHIIEAPTVNE